MSADQQDVNIDMVDEAIEISAEREVSRVFMQKCGKGEYIVYSLQFAVCSHM